MTRIKYTENNLIRRWLGSKENIIFLWIFFVLFAKVIRYTILKETLVDAGIGHKMVISINNHSTVFSLFDSQNSKDSIGDSIGNAAFFWEKTNFFHLSTYIEFEVCITIIWNLLLIFIISKCKPTFNTLESLFIVMAILMLNIFDFTIAKEPIQMLFFLAIFFILNSNKRSIIKAFWSLVIIFVSIITFRSYYILMLYWAFIFLFLQHLILNKKTNICRILVVFIGIAFSYLLLLMVVQKVSPSTYTEFIRVRTRMSDATTDIQMWLPSPNLIMFSVNYFIIILRLLFPVELIRFGPKFLMYVFCQLVMSCVYFKVFPKMKTASFEEKISFVLFSGYIFMSAAFEPDFGSWVRHEAALFPVMVMFSGLISSQKTKTTETAL